MRIKTCCGDIVLKLKESKSHNTIEIKEEQIKTMKDLPMFFGVIKNEIDFLSPRLLYNLLKSLHNIRVNWDKLNFADEFSKLKVQIGNTTQEVEHVLSQVNHTLLMVDFILLSYIDNLPDLYKIDLLLLWRTLHIISQPPLRSLIDFKKMKGFIVKIIEFCDNVEKSLKRRRKKMMMRKKKINLKFRTPFEDEYLKPCSSKNECLNMI